MLGTKVAIKDLTTDLNDSYAEKNISLKPTDADFEHFYLECKVELKLETIVSKMNNRKILKFNVIDIEA